MGNAQRDPSEDLDRVPFPAVSCCPAKECMLTASFFGHFAAKQPNDAPQGYHCDANHTIMCVIADAVRYDGLSSVMPNSYPTLVL